MKKKKPQSKESKEIITAYPDGKCPDCFQKIPRNVKTGEDCSNCGHVFYS